MTGRTRIAWALFGLAALLAGLAGAYFSLAPRSASEPALFQRHGSPRPVADLGFEDAAGGKRALSEFRGKVVLLNLWATWCAPCREEMPALDRLQQKLGGPRFEVVALAIDAGGARAVKQFYEEMGVRSLAVYVDPSMRAMSGLGVVGIPTTLLVDRAGREIGRRTGPAPWDGPEAEHVIASYME
jgi:thiol-disulfide isomerase/thioredoxin